MLTKVAVVLENAGIAWPNPSMWCQAPPGWYSVTSSPTKQKAGEQDSHGHSPHSQVVPNDSPPTHHADKVAPLRILRASSGSLEIPQVFSAPLGSSRTSSASHSLGNFAPQLSDPSWSPLPPMPDPFIDDSKSQSRRTQARYGSSEDHSMPDYSRSITPSSEHVDAPYDVPHITIHGEPATPATAESQFEEMMASFLDGEDGVPTPVDTKDYGAVRRPNLLTESIASTGPRTFSFPDGQLRAVPVSIRDPPPPRSREHSDVSMGSGHSECSEPTQQPAGTVKRNPALIIQSRKEGLVSARKSATSALAKGDKKEDRKWSQESSLVAMETSRKRAAPYSKSTVLRENSSSTPTRKLSGMGGKGDILGADVTEITLNEPNRPPLGEINNVQ